MSSPTKKRSSESVSSSSETNTVLSPSDAVPFSSLNSQSDRPTIAVMVLQKGELRSYKNDRGQGCLFSMTLADVSNIALDEFSSSAKEWSTIDCTAFNDTAKIVFGMVEEQKTYLICGFHVKPKSQYSRSKHFNDLTLSSSCKVEPYAFESFCSPLQTQALMRQKRGHFGGGLEEDGSSSSSSYGFSSISDIPSMKEGDIVTFAALILQVEEPVTFMTKKGQSMTKQTVHLVDHTRCMISLTLFAKQCNGRDILANNVIVLRRMKVNVYQNEISVTSDYRNGSTITVVTEETRETAALRRWIKETPADEIQNPTYFHDVSASKRATVVNQSVTALDLMRLRSAGGWMSWFQSNNFHDDVGESMFLQSMATNEKILGALSSDSSEVNVCYVLRAMILDVRADAEHPITYLCCPICKKKLSERLPSGGYRCQSCNQVIQNPGRNFVLTLVLADATGTAEVTLFGNHALILLKGAGIFPPEEKEPNADYFYKQLNPDGKMKDDEVRNLAREVLTSPQALKFLDAVWVLREPKEKKDGKVTFWVNDIRFLNADYNVSCEKDRLVRDSNALLQ